MDYLPEAPESFLVSAEEARGQVDDSIECGKVTARSRGSCLIIYVYLHAKQQVVH